MPSPSRIGLLAATVAAACGLLACGSSETATPADRAPRQLTAAERAAARSGHEAIRSYCRRLGLHIAGRRAAPGVRSQRRAIEGARAIAVLARRKPEARYTSSQTARQLAGDTAEDLEGTNCSGRLVAELARGL